MKKQNVCVYIENEAQLQQAKELLEKYGETYDSDSVLEPAEWYLLIFDVWNAEWHIGYKHEKGVQITLSELEEILKHEK